MFRQGQSQPSQLIPMPSLKGKKKPDRQHGARGASFIRFHDNLLAFAEGMDERDKALIGRIAEAAKVTGKQIRRLR